MKTKIFIISFVIAMLVVSISIPAGDGSTRVKLGYLFNDDEGNLGVNQETYNTYEGFALSIEQLKVALDNGLKLSGNFENITLNNRNLRFALAKPGLFNASFSHNQYRRTYDFEGSRFTRRRSSYGQLSITPSRNFKMFGGFSSTLRNGQQSNIFSPTPDTINFATDFKAYTLNVGSELRGTGGQIRAEYRKSLFYNNLNSDLDRKGYSFRTSFFARVPDLDWLTLSGGYFHRLVEHHEMVMELTSDHYWGATRLYLPAQFTLEERLSIASTEHTGQFSETEILTNTLSLGKTWLRRAGLKVGYEYREADDKIDRTVANGYLVSGWYHYRNLLSFKGQYRTRSDEVKQGAILTGDEDFTSHSVSATWHITELAKATARWQARLTENDDIGSQADYDSFSAVLNLVLSRFGHFNASYVHNEGQYDNVTRSFEFIDDMLTTRLYCDQGADWEAGVDFTYYRSARDLDIEKIGFGVSAAYEFIPRHYLEGRFTTFTYDDFLVSNNYYTANIFEINFIKDLKI